MADILLANGQHFGSKGSVTIQSDRATNDYPSGQATGWTGLVRVDNTTYTWMGNPNPLPEVANQTSFTYTSTRSIFEFDVGDLVSLKIRFISPITPDDLLRQSAPVSYLSIEVSSKDDQEHDVQIYTDVSAGTSLIQCTLLLLNVSLMYWF